MYQRMTCAAARTAVLLYSTWWVGEWVGEWVRGFGWLTCFAVLFSGPMLLSLLDHGALRTNL